VYKICLLVVYSSLIRREFSKEFIYKIFYNIRFEAFTATEQIGEFSRQSAMFLYLYKYFVVLRLKQKLLEEDGKFISY
jgi:hypothetical protein